MFEVAEFKAILDSIEVLLKILLKNLIKKRDINIFFLELHRDDLNHGNQSYKAQLTTTVLPIHKMYIELFLSLEHFQQFLTC